MSKQPEARRLADALTENHPYPLDIKQAAAELRRLAAVEAQRDALLEALRLITDCAGVIATAPDIILEIALTDGDEEMRRQANAFLVARAAIKAVEETK